MKQFVYSRIKDGHLSNEAELRFLAVLATNEEKEIRITIERKRRTISNVQRNFLNGPFVEALQIGLNESGIDCDKELAKSILKDEYGIKETIKLPSGATKLVAISTEKYSPAQCEEVMENARRGWAQWIQLPYPHENIGAPFEAYLTV